MAGFRYMPAARPGDCADACLARLDHFHVFNITLDSTTILQMAVLEDYQPLFFLQWFYDRFSSP